MDTTTNKYSIISSKQTAELPLTRPEQATATTQQHYTLKQPFPNITKADITLYLNEAQQTALAHAGSHSEPSPVTPPAKERLTPHSP